MSNNANPTASDANMRSDEDQERTFVTPELKRDERESKAEVAEEKRKGSISFEALSSLDAPVSFWKGIPFGLQHVLAMFVANLAPIFLVAAAGHMSPQDSAKIIQAGLLVAGLGTCLQLYGIWLSAPDCQWSPASPSPTSPPPSPL